MIYGLTTFAWVHTLLSLVGLVDLRLSPELGGAFAERAMAAGQMLAKMSASERELYAREQRAIVERQVGADNYEATLERASKAFKLAKETGWKIAMRKNGVFHDAWLLLTMANHGARIEAREAKKS